MTERFDETFRLNKKGIAVFCLKYSEGTNFRGDIFLSEIRLATHADLTAVKRLADQHKGAIGFVLFPALQEAVERGALLVAVDSENRICGFVNFRHRKQDDSTTLYEICVELQGRRKGVGRDLVNALIECCRTAGKHIIQLKCPVDLSANHFYANLGFQRVEVVCGKRRNLNVWKLRVGHVVDN